MRFSVSLISDSDTPVAADDIGEFVKGIEALGYHAIYLPDHYYRNYANFHSMTTAAVVAAFTERVKIGFCAFQLPIRHPIAVAKEFAMLDGLSRGRAVAGFATGSYAAEFEALGLDFRNRGRMMDEALEAITKLWTGEKVSHSGAFWSFEDILIEAAPVQKPHPPIWIASWTGGGRPAHRVAEHSGWQASGHHTHITQLREGWRHIAAAAEAKGRDPAEIEAAYVNTLVHFGETPDKAWDDFTRLSEKNKRRHRELCFLGDVSDIAAQVEELRDAGMDEVAFHLGLKDAEKARIIATEVMPKIRD
jgi:alkanesulfonate monooxygenase SsuD/methylene tetrahydromethanopterin reductase-like flavin-dependent oxidoreductase (luciferase family)